MKKTNMLRLSIASLLLAGSSMALAAQPYWVDKNNKVVRDGTGNCVQTIEWTKALATSECDASVVDVVEEPKIEPTPVVVAPKPVETPPPAPKVVTLEGDATFAFDSDVIKTEDRSALNALAQEIKSLVDVDSIEVAGHTDNTGPAIYNQGLSERRANAVKNFLMDQGVDGSNINTVGYGFDRPVADNATMAGRAANRRVEVTINGKQ